VSKETSAKVNIALIIAGGLGLRMNQDIPKQFLCVYDKPVIVYTLEAFQHHPLVSSIVAVCINGWHDILHAYAKQFGISKLENIVSGGDTGQESIQNGLMDIHTRHKDDTVVLIHDAIRPMVSEKIITDCINTCKLHGNAITVIPCSEAMLLTQDGHTSDKHISRDALKRTQTPQAARLGTLLAAHREALANGIANSIATCTLLVELGEKLHFCQGAEKNIKLTTLEDIEIFKALLTSKKVEWMH
jgi:2-C-methyl-D-erythritol 4-phosphate cytidylyltransferase